MVYTTGTPGDRVEKTMSFTQVEFEAGLRRLIGEQPQKTNGTYDLSKAAEGAPVTCTFDPLPDAVLGGLVRLPRVQVVLDMSALDTSARTEFLARFEKTFQRGGG